MTVGTSLILTGLSWAAFAVTDPTKGPKPNVVCEMTATSTFDNPAQYGFEGKEAGVPVTYPDLSLMRTYCYIENAADTAVPDTFNALHSLSTMNYPACGSSSGIVCAAYQKVHAKTLLKADKTLVAEFVIQNRTDKDVTLNPANLVGNTKADPADALAKEPSPVNWSPTTVSLKAPLTDGKCRVLVSGSLDPIPDDVALPEVRVTNGKLLFTATVTGHTGMGGEVKQITWAGGPDANGLWENPPLNVTSTVTATVKLAAGMQLTCGIKVRPGGQDFSIGLARFGDCSFFGALRTYYYLDAQNKGFQNQGYKPPIRLLGIPVKYGEESADIPFRGVINAAASQQGIINVGTNGDVVHPPVQHRQFAEAVVVARTFDPATKKLGKTPLAWGRLNLSNYSVTQLQQLANAGDEETVVFQAYLAAAQLSGGQDLRGTTDANAIPLWHFTPGTSNNKPFDRVVPFVNASCGVMSVPVPARKDKEVTPELQALKMCSFSKPYKVADLKSGRVNLEVMHITPEHGTHVFPPNLLKTMAKTTSCNTSDPVKRSCWNISAASLGMAAEEDPFKNHESCREVKIVETDVQVCDGYGCHTVKYPTQVETYKASCKVLETNECGPALAIRFSGYNQMMLGALGCAAKYDRPGENVTATLMNQGILPYTTFGGSAPKAYTSYPAAYGETNGYACIPCRFATDAAKAGSSLENDTAVLPVDQDASSPRKPIFSFTKSTAASSCVKDVTFEVRYFGSGACDGTNTPPGHFCSSGNIQPQNCTAADGMGGGNVAGKFKIPVCPGSGIEYESVSVSWSPIIIDVAGNGISISRSFDQARQFDIRGDGRKRILDWPINNQEVAFLVRPDKKGGVTSIKQLFGDYKAKNGFEALRKLDSNRDGVINRKDRAFEELALWFDRNRNAVADAGEIEPLDIHGIYELPLQYSQPNSRGVDGRTLSGAYFNHKRNRHMNIEDHYFYEYTAAGQKKNSK